MFEITRKSDRRADVADNRPAMCGVFLWISLLLVFGFAVAGQAEAAGIPSRPVSYVGPGSQFAIGDFDGDLRPDVASIEAADTAPGTSSYWIDLHLSALGLQSIQLVAPAGGLQIEARDVNGDHALDLIFTTAWFRQPVAIFLNDGHGRFSRAEPSAFPAAFRDSGTNWVPCSNLTAEILGVAPRSGGGLCTEEETSLQLRSPAESIRFSTAGFPTSVFLVSQPGRAPPSEDSHL